MLIGYNTNGLAHHDPFQAIELLAEIGYRSVAITLDHGRLNPFSPDFASQLIALRRLLERLKLRSVIETGARYLLDPRRKHEPTLVSPDEAGRSRRIAFLKAAIDAAHELQSDCVSLWSGVVHDGADLDSALARLLAGLRPTLDHAQAKNVTIGFEPEPGMLIDTMDRYEQLDRLLDHPCFQLTLDVGHLHCLGEVPIASHIRRWRQRLVNIHIEDMRSGVHEHLKFGEGEIDFPPVIQALVECGYTGGVHVELSRHSHVGPEAARQAFAFLADLLSGRGAPQNGGKLSRSKW